MNNSHARAAAIFNITATVALLASASSTALGWGAKGHDMQARTAIRALPAEMPDFFRKAEEEMAFLILEPDRWRTSEQPALTETAAGNHTFKWELAPKPLPA